MTRVAGLAHAAARFIETVARDDIHNEGRRWSVKAQTWAPGGAGSFGRRRERRRTSGRRVDCGRHEQSGASSWHPAVASRTLRTGPKGWVGRRAAGESLRLRTSGARAARSPTLVPPCPGPRRDCPAALSPSRAPSNGFSELPPKAANIHAQGYASPTTDRSARCGPQDVPRETSARSQWSRRLVILRSATPSRRPGSFRVRSALPYDARSIGGGSPGKIKNYQ